ncbi:phage replication initiation protein, NGO0469 family [Spirosoma lituiforme]
MSLTTIIKKNQLREQLPDAAHPALLRRIIELGSLPTVWNNVTTIRPRLLLTWVIPSITLMIGDQPRPALVHKEYLFSLQQNAHLYKDIVAMRGREFGDEYDNTPFDVLSILGMPCLVTTKQETGKQPIVISLEAFPEDEFYPETDLSFQSLTYTNFDWALYNSLSKTVREKMEKTPQFQQVLAQNPTRQPTAVDETAINLPL